MDFIEEISMLGVRVRESAEMIKTEEATKQAFVLPFIRALGYDVYNPLEVIPEYTVDHGIKKGEKVDYAIVKEDKPIMLLECKWCGSKLNNAHASQLFRYFSVTEARVAVLTNGIVYRFFADLDKPNQMDPKPFLEFDLLNLQENLLSELAKFAKPSFNLDELIPTAVELKYTREIQQILIQQITDPHEDFIRFFASRVFPGRLRGNILDQFSGLTRKAFVQLINNEINKRFDLVMGETRKPSQAEKPLQAKMKTISKQRTGEQSSKPSKQRIDGQSLKQKAGPNIITTDAELEGFQHVKDILKDTVDLTRVFFRDNAKYFAVLLDDNRRRPICRLYFDYDPKQIEIMDKHSTGRLDIHGIEDVKHYSSRLIALVRHYDGHRENETSELANKRNRIVLRNNHQTEDEI